MDFYIETIEIIFHADSRLRVRPCQSYGDVAAFHWLAINRTDRAATIWGRVNGTRAKAGGVITQKDISTLLTLFWKGIKSQRAVLFESKPVSNLNGPLKIGSNL